MAEDLSLGQPRTNPASGQSGTQTRHHRIVSPMPWPLGHIASPPFLEEAFSYVQTDTTTPNIVGLTMWVVVWEQME